jgi:hypothetical protein
MYQSKKSVPSPETELISMLFTPGMSPTENFPWNPAEVEAESFYQVQESQFSLEDWSAEELTESSNSFFTKLNACWPDNSVELLANLSRHFSARIPQQWLEKIAAEAKKAMAEQATMADQLVSCVQNVLPELAQDVLSILARPHTYAMRSEGSSTSLTNLDSLTNSTDWEKMSAIEQAKLTVFVSKYALEQLTPE